MNKKLIENRKASKLEDNNASKISKLVCCSKHHSSIY